MDLLLFSDTLKLIFRLFSVSDIVLPPESFDLNRTEHIWDVVERKIRILEGQPINLQELQDAITKECTKISKKYFLNIVEFMSKRIEVILMTNEGTTC